MPSLPSYPSRWPVLAMGLVVCVGLAGCPTPRDPAALEGEPVALQMQRRAPQLVVQRFSNLLSFELPTDTVFIATEKPVSIDLARAHTGSHSLLVEPPVRRVSVRLAPLLVGRTFPDEWTLLGAYLSSDREADVTVRLLTDQGAIERPVVVPAGVWTPATVDLSDLPQAAESPQPKALEINVLTPGARVWVDDVMLIDNRKVLVEQSPIAGHWRVEHRGLRVNVELDDAQLSLPYDRWTLEEAGLMRVRFASTTGDDHVTLYADGRGFWGGEFRPLLPVANQAIYAKQHDSPADVSVPEAMGRLERRTPGDANNDGYNEQLGAYQVRAHGGRIDVRIAPNSAAVLNPIIEIAGLPDGRILATLEGKLVEQVARADDGRVLVVVPARIERPMTLNVRVQ